MLSQGSETQISWQATALVIKPLQRSDTSQCNPSGSLNVSKLNNMSMTESERSLVICRFSEHTLRVLVWRCYVWHLCRLCLGQGILESPDLLALPVQALHELAVVAHQLLCRHVQRVVLSLEAGKHCTGTICLTYTALSKHVQIHMKRSQSGL